MSTNNQKILNKNFKILNLKNKKKLKITPSTKKTNLLKKDTIYNSDFNKLSKNERSKKEFEKANLILQKKNKQVINSIIKKNKSTNKLLALENEKKKLLEMETNVTVLCMALFTKIQKNKR